MQNTSRRDFLKFLGASGYALSSLSFVSSIKSYAKVPMTLPSKEDDVILHKGLSYYPIISWGDKINEKEVFGFNNDYIETHMIDKDELIMWVNHEYINPLFVSSIERTKKNVDIERSQIGGSLIHIKKTHSKWSFLKGSAYNKGVRGDTPIPFANNVKVMGTNNTIGTVANCAGGKTPWGTFLTCEENYQFCYGHRDPKTKKVSSTKTQWEKFYPHPPEHYGWVVEIEPKTGKAKKHTNLGRFSHESATCVLSKTQRVCVYSGDDKSNEFLYKFISESAHNFNKGVLYVADIKNGKWLPLDLELSPILKKTFPTQLDVQIHTRQAAKILGATALNRPEDIEIHPTTKDVYIALTNNKESGDFFGSILKISEHQKDHGATTFKTETFILGGEMSHLACPDNLVFDKQGNLWVSTDISTKALNKEQYTPFGNNGIFVIPTTGKDAGKAIQIASAPNDAEFTGLKFDPSEQTLFVSVQHPGESTTDLKKPTSTWPTGKIPKPTVIAITGDYLKKYTSA